MVAPIRRLLLQHPRDAFQSQERLEATWREQGFLSCPDFAAALREYDAFVELLSEWVPDIAFLSASSRTGLDAVYVHDPAIVSDRGAILGRMGKAARSEEPAMMGEALAALDVPVLGAVLEPGRLEGGDVLWVDRRVLAVGEGYRTNADGIRQLRELLAGAIDEIVVVPLPHWRGPESCLHLMSFISLIDRDLALVHSRLIPVPFREWLLERGVRLVEVPEAEYDSLGCNVLAVAPRSCVMVEGNPITRRRLETAGAAVREFRGREICLKGEGGPTCLTRPLHRAPAR
jgi:N-dimethylarginine dimethylaminohydrolase